VILTVLSFALFPVAVILASNFDRRGTLRELIDQGGRMKMKAVSRREAISTLATGTAGLAFAAVLRPDEADGQTTGPVARAFQGQHTPKPLPFDPAKLKGLSEKLIRSHWENNYGGAVRALNVVEQRLAAMLPDKDLPAYIYGDLKREELVRTGSVVLHEYYFANLGGDGKASGKPIDLIKQWFGSYEQWEAEFKKTANALGGGSGWTILSYNLHTGEVHNYWLGITCTTRRWAIRCWCSICTNTRITWITAPQRPNTSTLSCKT
jgi:Fe-Mn family superoxide dismutase